MNTVIILRAPSGSGKTTLVSKLEKDYGKPAYVCSADHYWYNGKEEIIENYNFDITKLHVAHNYCKQKFESALKDNEPFIVVDNTNITLKEYKFYFQKANEFKYNVVFHTIINGSVEESLKSNVHRVPREALVRMYNTFMPTPKEIDGILTDEIIHDFYELRGIKKLENNMVEKFV